MYSCWYAAHCASRWVIQAFACCRSVRWKIESDKPSDAILVHTCTFRVCIIQSAINDECAYKNNVDELECIRPNQSAYYPTTVCSIDQIHLHVPSNWAHFLVTKWIGKTYVFRRNSLICTESNWPIRFQSSTVNLSKWLHRWTVWLFDCSFPNPL